MIEQTYRGSWQCEAVQFEAALDLDNTMTCNCSRCQRLGWAMAFAPRAKIKVSRGEGGTTAYLFNKRQIRHEFRQTFASRTAPDGAQTFAVSVNCLDGVDPRALQPKAVDGRSL